MSMKLSDVIACVRGDVFATKLVTAGPSKTVSAVALRMREHNVGAVVVVEGQKPVGIVTDRLLTPKEFWAIGQFYADFAPVEDEQVTTLLRRAFARSQESGVRRTARDW